MIELPSRSQVEEQYKWRVEKLYPNQAAWEADFEQLRDKLPQVAAWQGHLAESKENILDCLHWQEQTGIILERLYLYASLRHDEDTNVPEFQALSERVHSLAVAYSQATAFFSPEILAMDEATLSSYLAAPEMQLYSRLFENITRDRPHTLSPAEEQLLAGTADMSSGFSTAYNLLTNADMTFPLIKNEQGAEERLSAGNYIRFLRSEKREVRRAAFEAQYSSFAAFGNTIAALLSASVRKDNFYAGAAKHQSALHASLFSDNVEESVYHNLIACVRSHKDDMLRYLQRRRELMGLSELHMYDIYVPLLPEPKNNFSWEEAKELVLKALAPLGADYCATLKQGLDSGWVDVFENKGKTSGAYSSGVYGTDPYILLNYQSDLNSVFTLIHEAGHSMHSYYSRRLQPYVYADYRIFVAEVASTVNENLLIDYLLKQSQSSDETRYLVNHYLEEFRGTVIRQTMFAEFELLIHQAAAEGKPLNAEALSAIYYQLNQDYFGEGVVVDEQIAWEWARIPHFYRAYYVYKYATGFCAASSLAMGLLDPDPGKAAAAQKRYLNFLAAGSSKDPLDLLADAGVDMRTTAPIERGFEMFNQRLAQL